MNRYDQASASMRESIREARAAANMGGQVNLFPTMHPDDGRAQVQAYIERLRVALSLAENAKAQCRDASPVRVVG